MVTPVFPSTPTATLSPRTFMAIRNLLKLEWVALGCYVYWRRRAFIEYMGSEGVKRGFNKRQVDLYLADVEGTTILQGYQVLLGMAKPFAGQELAVQFLGRRDKDLWRAMCSGEVLEDVPFAMLPFRFRVKQWWLEGLDLPTADSIFNDFLEAWYHSLYTSEVPETLESQEALHSVLQEALSYLDRESARLGEIIRHCETSLERVHQWLEECR
ncbi:hypothetical protein NMY22_g1670 [Coprinellus aureogranulatus]|nr:hypothetical protein NMY22_g1670 [Coprinellus aureogranulatus]